MAYDVNTDYSTLIAQLKKQLTGADPTTAASLNQQLAAAQQSRIEKGASNLNLYGQYLDPNELSSAAGVVAQNQIGNQFDQVKAQTQDYYKQARQVAENDALSRGMARSSFTTDRLATLGSKEANALSGVDSNRATAVYNAQQGVLRDYYAKRDAQLAQQKADALSRAETLGKYGDFSGYSGIDGYTPENIANMTAAYVAANTPVAGGGSGGGGGGGDTAAAKQYNEWETDLYEIYKMNLDAMGQLTDAGRAAMYDYATKYTGDAAAQLLSKYNPGYNPTAQQTKGIDLALSKAKNTLDSAARTGFKGMSYADTIKKITDDLDKSGLSPYEIQQVMMQIGLA